MKDERNETTMQEQTPEAGTPGFDLAAEIEAMKEKRVPIEEYNRVQEQLKTVFEAWANDSKVPSEDIQIKPTVEELRKKLFNSEADLTNLEFVQAAVDLRDALIKEGKEDPFLPAGKQITATRDDALAAEDTANAFKYCLEIANGDPDVFNRELQRITRDVRRY